MQLIKPLLTSVLLALVTFSHAQTDTLDIANTRVTTVAGQVMLQDGAFARGDTSVTLLDVLDTDLDSDGVLDAAALTMTNTGGTGRFYEMHGFVENRGVPQQVATLFLGDRVRIDEFASVNGTVVLNLVRSDADDPACCPSMQVTERYRLSGGRFRQVAEESNFVLALQEGTYRNPDPNAPASLLTLINGRYERTFGDARADVSIVLSRYALADLDYDRDQDAAVVLERTRAGEHTLALTIMRNVDAGAQNVASRELEAAQVTDVYVEAGIITLELITLGESDPACCPRTRVTQRYVLDGDVLLLLEETPANALNFDLDTEAIDVDIDWEDAP